MPHSKLLQHFLANTGDGSLSQILAHDSICLITVAFLTASHTRFLQTAQELCVPANILQTLPDWAGREWTQPKATQAGQGSPAEHSCPLHRQLPSPCVLSLLQMCTEQIWVFVLQSCLVKAAGILTQRSLQSKWKLKLFVEPGFFSLISAFRTRHLTTLPFIFMSHVTSSAGLLL